MDRLVGTFFLSNEIQSTLLILAMEMKLPGMTARECPNGRETFYQYFRLMLSSQAL